MKLNLKVIFNATFFIFYSFLSFANDNLPNTGKVVGIGIEKQELQGYMIGDSGENVIWDLSAYEKARNMTQLYLKDIEEHPSFVTVVEESTRYYIENLSDGISLKGTENSLTKIDYEKPYALMPTSFKVGNSSDTYYWGYGNYCDRMKFISFGQSHLTTDASGTVILPDGKIYKDVFRTHHKTVECVLPMSDKDSLYVFCTDSVHKYLPLRNNVTTETYRWYSPSNLFPILETIITTSASGENIVSYIYEYDKEDVTENTHKGMHDAYSRSIDFTADCPTGTELLLSFDANNDIDVSWQLSTIGGAVVVTVPEHHYQAGNVTISKNVSHLQPGPYVVTVLSGNNKSTRTVVIK